MPNWCNNVIKISGEKEKLKKFIEKCGLDKEHPEFDFDAIIRVPQELEISVSPITVVETEEEAKQINIESHRNKFITANILAISKKEEKRRLQKYGAIDWYDFCVNAWGVKWPPVNVVVHEKSIDNDIAYIIISFDTPWGPAEPIAKKLEKEGFEISGAYVEEGCGVKGYYLDNKGGFGIEECEEEDGYTTHNITW